MRAVKKLVHESNIKFDSWNIETLNSKSFEVAQIMSKHKINILYFLETTKEGSREMKVNGSKLWCTGKINGRNEY